MSTAEISQEIIVAPFGIEADHPRNSDLYIQCIPGVRLRSAIRGDKHVIDAKTGEPRTPLDQVRQLATFPKTPGMQLHVNPTKLTYSVYDPLSGDEDLRERITKWCDQNMPIRMTATIKGCETQQGTLDKHRMKSLCREMFWLVNAGEAKVADGELPTMEEISELPGHFLLNPGSRTYNSQPQFEKDFDEWCDNLARGGG